MTPGKDWIYMVSWREARPDKGVLSWERKDSPLMHTLEAMAAYIQAKTEELGPHTYILQIREMRKRDVR